MTLDCARGLSCAIVLLLCFASGIKALKITDLAVPKSVNASENAELQCVYELGEKNEVRAGLEVKWWFVVVGEGGEEGPRKQIYQRLAGHEPQSLRDDVIVKDKDTILLEDLQPDDSGSYECQVYGAAAGDEDRRRGLLLVYSEGSGPGLNVTEIPDDEDEDDSPQVLITCEAYDVAPKPELEISVNFELLNISQWVSAPVNGRYNTTANVTVPSPRVQDANIKCELLFENEDITHPPYVDTIENYLAGFTSTEPALDETTELSAVDAEDMQMPTDAGDELQTSLAVVLLGSLLLRCF